jgi:hypothetical protein
MTPLPPARIPSTEQVDVLPLHGPVREEVLRRAQAARAAHVTALFKGAAVGVAAGLDRLRDRVLGAVSDRALSGHR